MSEYCGREDCLYILPHQHTQFGVIGATQVSIMYTLNCQRCGGVHHSPDGFALLCPRCQQLAALEAEIGRLQIGAMMVSSLDDIVSDVSVVNNSPHNPHLWTHLWCLIEKEQDGLIARWRKLHAEGAEGEKK